MFRVLVLMIALLNTVSYGIEEKECYSVRYLFITVAEACIKYNISSGEIKTEAEAHTVGFFKLMKDISYAGFSTSTADFNSKEFFFRKKEKESIELHHYIFGAKWISYKKITITGADEKKEVRKIKNNGYIDPLTATLYYYRQVKERKPIEKKIFYNGKEYFVPYKKIKERDIKINNRTYRTVYVEIDPSKIKVGGILQPTGLWKLWIDKNKNRLIKGEIRIRIGKVQLEIK